ncbi:hypothetical protein MUS1_06820 [Marinomonas ushuaiensis DSM 15871]|uniref:Uncharacterized protein n=1 Tax=Marinomonas ushuaiensis DSM 15871 TaxID=1122207 RepID=X7E116_9GAMM|nr:hypothetical protein [Marinomonas ushuaiensis]ETX09540.1 hypothetical protein MUS1_06820 [Marinomonas ushuaiensis DSM 15871]
MPEVIEGVGSPVGSRYISQKVITGEPCESPFKLPISQGQLALTCQPSNLNVNNDNGIGNNLNVGICDAACGTDVQGQCGCPAGYYSITGKLVETLGLNGQCCPI